MGYYITWKQTRSFTDDEWNQIKTQVSYLSYRFEGHVFQTCVHTYADAETEFLQIDAGGIDIHAEPQTHYGTFQLEKDLVLDGEDYNSIRGTRSQSVKTHRGIYGFACFELLRFVEFIAAGALIDIKCDGLEGIYGDNFQNNNILKLMGGSR
jgi:hypothetical protein